MFVIRQKHLEALERAASDRFMQEALAYLEETFPSHWTYAGENNVRAVLTRGVQRARSHRLTSERNVLQYVSLMFLLGSGFDQDPQYPWVAQLLDDSAVPSEDVRMERLQNKVKEYLEQWAEDFEGGLEEGSRLIGEL